MKTLSSILMIALLLTLNAQAVNFNSNLLEIREVNILEKDLNTRTLK